MNHMVQFNHLCTVLINAITRSNLIVWKIDVLSNCTYEILLIGRKCSCCHANPSATYPILFLDKQIPC